MNAVVTQKLHKDWPIIIKAGHNHKYGTPELPSSIQIHLRYVAMSLYYVDMFLRYVDMLLYYVDMLLRYVGMLLYYVDM